MNIYDDKLGKSLDLFNGGFTSQTQKKEVNNLLLAAYDFVIDELRQTIKEDTLSRAGASDEPITMPELYFSIPRLQHWKEKHSQMFALYPVYVEKIAQLVSLRSATKLAPVTPIETKMDNSYHKESEKIQEAVSSLLSKKNKQYIEGVQLAEMFNGLSVSVKAHRVSNARGTEFTRHFYYLEGKLTALNLIVAIAYNLDIKNSNKQ